MKDEILPFLTWIDLEGVMLSKINQTEKGKNYITSFICGVKKNQQNKQTNKNRKQAYIYKEQICGYHKWGW